ncbi:Myosin-6-like [Caenorhabditis elegans]|uniref:Myosin-6-like n=1 Tax=Caenorhabditis elegans TaxID=6239 RepID=C7IVQ8_CAEEL|nr:Myosin-6-like [Caenorhabditis elegans]CCD69703.1 Myosin-6-like [Caenorhabditis elegans]|eukprot:NP_494606.2 Uncharacterized protein CELE_F19B10.4 [Caenorhabditis elegans]
MSDLSQLEINCAKSTELAQLEAVLQDKVHTLLDDPNQEYRRNWELQLIENTKARDAALDEAKFWKSEFRRVERLFQDMRKEYKSNDDREDEFLDKAMKELDENSLKIGKAQMQSCLQNELSALKSANNAMKTSKNGPAKEHRPENGKLSPETLDRGKEENQEGRQDLEHRGSVDSELSALTQTPSQTPADTPSDVGESFEDLLVLEDNFQQPRPKSVVLFPQLPDPHDDHNNTMSLKLRSAEKKNSELKKSLDEMKMNFKKFTREYEKEKRELEKQMDEQRQTLEQDNARNQSEYDMKMREMREELQNLERKLEARPPCCCSSQKQSEESERKEAE